MVLFNIESFRRGESSHNPNAADAPPRPAGWGKPTAERAKIEAEKIAARNIESPESSLDRAWAVHFVMERAKCGRGTAETAVDAVQL